MVIKYYIHISHFNQLSYRPLLYVYNSFIKHGYMFRVVMSVVISAMRYLCLLGFGFCFVCPRLCFVYRMLPVFLGCPFLISPPFSLTFCFLSTFLRVVYIFFVRTICYVCFIFATTCSMCAV